MTEDKSAGWAAYYEKLRDRPPRRTLLAALDAFGAPDADALAIDLGCGDGRDVVEMLRRGWRVVAVDAEPEALRQLQARAPADRQRHHADRGAPRGRAAADRPQPGEFELRHAALRAGDDSTSCGTRIREALPPGGRFSGQWYGPRDSWAGRPGMTFLERDEALALLDGFELEMFEEEEADGVTPRGNAKHWHIFHIVARKLSARLGLVATGSTRKDLATGERPVVTGRVVDRW